MTRKERIFLALSLVLIISLVFMDILTDSKEGAPVWHLLAEGSVGVIAAIGVLILLKSIFTSRHEIAQQKESLKILKEESEILKEKSEVWKANSKKYIEGLSTVIDQQLTQWHLTHAEKEVALLLLKGLSIKEVATVRNTSEKTTRAQSTMVYQKSGLSGRSELSAFFLEDLLSPQTISKTDRTENSEPS